MPDTFEGSADRTVWPGLLLEKAEDAMQARSDSEVYWADRAEEFTRAPNPPEGREVEVPTEVVDSVIAGMRKGKNAGGDGLTAETVQTWPDSVKARLAGSFSTLINDREAKWLAAGLAGMLSGPDPPKDVVALLYGFGANHHVGGHEKGVRQSPLAVPGAPRRAA